MTTKEAGRPDQMVDNYYAPKLWMNLARVEFWVYLYHLTKQGGKIGICKFQKNARMGIKLLVTH